MPDLTPVEELRVAAKLMRELAEAVPQGAWDGQPWAVEACASRDEDAPDESGCLCIVYQGENKPSREPQVPLIQYVADAETEEHAAFIASWDPRVAPLVADLLERAAERIEVNAFGAKDLIGRAITIARAYLEGNPHA